jgi:hypothetical protein
MQFPVSIGVPLTLPVLSGSLYIILHQQCVRYPCSKSSASFPQQSLAIFHFHAKYSLQSYARSPLRVLNGLMMRHSTSSLGTLSNDTIDFSACLASLMVSNSQLRSLQTRTLRMPCIMAGCMTTRSVISWSLPRTVHTFSFFGSPQ